MKEFYGIGAATAAIVLAATQAASAAPTQVTNVRLNPSRSGVDVVLETQAGDRAPQVFNVNRGNTWTAYIFNTQLRGGQSFQQNNPAPGIASIAVTPVGGNGIQVTVVGQGNTAPTGQIASRNAKGVILSVSGAGGGGAPVAQAPASTPAAPSATPAPPLGVPIAPLVPNPTITTTPPTVPVAPVPPFLPRAVAPPVGDITVAPIDVSPSSIDLGSAERIPRLVLRDAPVREVLSLLARAAGLNLAFSESPGGQTGTAAGQATRSGGPTISLDIENESVQDVFNYVLRLACVPVATTGQGGGGQCGSLEATRSGRTIIVGTRLPNSARGALARSLRLNQISVSSAVNFLVGLGAESAVTRERQVRTVIAQSASQLEGAQQTTANQPATTETTTETRVEVQRAEFRDSTPFLRGMQVSGDERTNSITLIGTAKQIELATSQLIQLDSRRRMVAVNVKVIDVNLLALRRFGTTFSFGVGDSQILNQGGIAVLNFGRNTPGSSSATSDGTGSTIGTVVNIAGGASPVDFIRSFFAQLQASVVSGNAKILTDPTLVVQEGQTATVNLTQEVITNFVQNVTGGRNDVQTVTLTAEKRSAGLILPVKVDRIDDNGFISLSVAPSISQPESTQSINIAGINGSPGSSNIITLLSERKLESGQIRLRDGQTLVLSGIIQEQDRATVTKVPILGDIPILGALFRRTERNNQRREVIVLLTPQIIDDSDRSTYGYGYTPGPEVRQVLQQNPGSR
ncbi:AMIN domain-containing protein [Phormidesmis priestleyi ULC007]|uniref:AMIN domain-containing protein n=1 Tax=Phormidesmis priestleyi ULC007 TaxID=1920490 RepID=A0A2T1D8J6_9CYAN|nr:type IV pilus secretin family protein [Phormidesmis priestleyi]PSB16829.1 AMIN domain-containing protein [Phormidesmis priestleyi ULC007]PZO47744.1 MAG: type IV pilus secretin family protein [Phormidesmis priestleyi]